MRVLVAGGAGYIGSHVVADLKDHGFGVVVLDNLSTGHQWAVGRVPIHGVRTNDYPMVKALFRNYKFDAVVDLASYSQVGESASDPMKYYQMCIRDSISRVYDDRLREHDFLKSSSNERDEDAPET